MPARHPRCPPRVLRGVYFEENSAGVILRILQIVEKFAVVRSSARRNRKRRLLPKEGAPYFDAGYFVPVDICFVFLRCFTNGANAQRHASASLPPHSRGTSAALRLHSSKNAAGRMFHARNEFCRNFSRFIKISPLVKSRIVDAHQLFAGESTVMTCEPCGL